MATGNLPVQGVREGSASAASGVRTPRPFEQPSKPPAIERPSQTFQVEEFTQEDLREVASAFGEAIGIINRGLRFRIDESSNQVITQVIDRNTDEVIRQIPPQELLDISQRLRSFVGALLDQEG